MASYLCWFATAYKPWSVRKNSICFRNAISHTSLHLELNLRFSILCKCQTRWWSRTRTSLPQLSSPSCITWPVMMLVERPWSRVAWWRPCWRLEFVSFPDAFLLKNIFNPLYFRYHIMIMIKAISPFLGNQILGGRAGPDHFCDAGGACCGPYYQSRHGCLSIPQRPFYLHLQTWGTDVCRIPEDFARNDSFL